MPQSAETIFRDFTTDGIPASGAHEPRKVEIREWGTNLEAYLAAGTANAGLLFTTLANLNVFLDYPPSTMAWVIGDPVAANNGVYQKIGASGTGSWVRRADLPFSFIRASDVGDGTPNAIQATTSIPIPSADGGALIALNVFEANTSSPVTVSFNGGTPLTVKTNSGNDITEGGLTAGMILAGYKSGSTFRLLSDQASAALVAAAEAAADRAEEARDEILAIDVSLNSLPVMPEAFGALHDGSDDKTAIEAAAAFALSNNRYVAFSAGRTYTFSQMTLPACRVRSNGAILRSDGSLTTGQTLTLNGTVFEDELHVTTPGTETNPYIIDILPGARIPSLRLVADTNHTTTGIRISHEDVHIGRAYSENIDRPYDMRGDGAMPDKVTIIGFLEGKNYRRGLYMVAAYGFHIDGYHFHVKSPNATFGIGQNGWLMEGCSGYVIGDGIVEDAGEHAGRIGGPGSAGGENYDCSIGVLTAIRPGGVAFKSTAPGITDGSNRPRNVSIKGVIGVDCGFGTGGNNRGLLRLTHVDGMEIGFAIARAEQTSVGAHIALFLNNTKNLHIGFIGGTFAAGVTIDEQWDVGTPAVAGPVQNIYIDRFQAVIVGGSQVIDIAMPNHAVGNVFINMDVTGFSTRLASVNMPTMSGPVVFSGNVGGSVAPSISGAPANPLFMMDFIYQASAFSGAPAFDFDSRGSMQLAVPTHNPANVKTNRGLMLSSVASTAGAGLYGGGIEGTGPGTTRRRWAIVPKQNTSTVTDVGVAIMLPGTTAASDVLGERFLFRQDGRITMESPNGSKWLCGPNNTGTWVCVAL